MVEEASAAESDFERLRLKEEKEKKQKKEIKHGTDILKE